MKVNKQAYQTCKSNSHIVGSSMSAGSIASHIVYQTFYGKGSVISKAATAVVGAVATPFIMVAGDLFVATTCPFYAKLIDIVPGAESLLGISGEQM